MRSLLLVVGVLLLSAPAAGADDKAQPKKPAANRFLELNPGYRERAGGSYEQAYLAGAARSLAKTVDHPKLPEEKARAVLKDFIYQFLDVYIEGGGEMTREEHVLLMEGIDKKVRDLLGDADAFKRFVHWRTGVPRTENPLQFLFVLAIPVSVQLPKEFTDAGWTLRSFTDLNETRKYNGYFGFPPDQVLVVEKQQAGQNGPVRIVMLAYPQTRIKDTLAQAKEPLAAKLDPFWQTYSHVLYILDGDLSAEQRQVTSSLKRQMLGR